MNYCEKFKIKKVLIRNLHIIFPFITKKMLKNLIIKLFSFSLKLVERFNENVSNELLPKTNFSRYRQNQHRTVLDTFSTMSYMSVYGLVIARSIEKLLCRHVGPNLTSHRMKLPRSYFDLKIE